MQVLSNISAFIAFFMQFTKSPLPAKDEIEFGPVTSVLADLILFVTDDEITDPKIREGIPYPSRQLREGDGLWEKSVVLFPQQLAATERWGHSRHGSNASSVPLPDLAQGEAHVRAQAEEVGLQEYDVRLMVKLHAC